MAVTKPLAVTFAMPAPGWRKNTEDCRLPLPAALCGGFPACCTMTLVAVTDIAEYANFLSQPGCHRRRCIYSGLAISLRRRSGPCTRPSFPARPDRATQEIFCANFSAGETL